MVYTYVCILSNILKFLCILFLAALDLHCCAWVFLQLWQAGATLDATCGLLVAVTSFVVKRRLQTHVGFSPCGTWTQLPRGMWDLLDQGSDWWLLHCKADFLPLDHQGSPIFSNI